LLLQRFYLALTLFRGTFASPADDGMNLENI